MKKKNPSDMKVSASKSQTAAVNNRETSANNPHTYCEYNSDSTVNEQRPKNKKKGPSTVKYKGNKKKTPQFHCLSFNIFKRAAAP